MAKSMQMWVKATSETKAERENAMHDAKLETVTREIITRYEAELEKLRSGIKAAHEEIARGHVQRQQLEEKMRRTFLKGMTAMNMEALELFNKAAQSDASFMSEVRTGVNGLQKTREQRQHPTQLI
jgi:centrosomal protein POC5